MSDLLALVTPHNAAGRAAAAGALSEADDPADFFRVKAAFLFLRGWGWKAARAPTGPRAGA